MKQIKLKCLRDGSVQLFKKSLIINTENKATEFPSAQEPAPSLEDRLNGVESEVVTIKEMVGVLYD